MNSVPNDFRERLIRCESVTPAHRQQYEKEMRAMLEKQLTGVRRWVWGLAALMGVGFAVLFGTVAVMMPAEFPLWGRLGFAAGALFGVGWAALGIRVLRRGSIHLKLDTGAAAGMAWALPVTLLTLFMVSAPDDVIGLRMILCGLVFLVMGVAFLLRHVIELSELKTREKLLQIEYRVAELSERIGALPTEK
jgi:hypothetical protein